MKRLAFLVLLALTACTHRPAQAPRLAERHCPEGYTPHKAMYQGQLIDICTRPDPVAGMTDVRVPGETPGDADEPDESEIGKRRWYCLFLRCGRSESARQAQPAK